MSKERLIAFTDAILAIIMTILVLELDKPAAPSVEAFWALRTSYFAYALSFFWLGSLWVGLNNIWDKAKRISTGVIWWNLLLLFLASLIPYATSLCSNYFMSPVMQGFYGIVVISMTVVNYLLHWSLEKPNADAPMMLEATRAYRKMLRGDIAIKCVGLLLAVTVYPPLMMYSVLVAAIYIISLKAAADRKAAKTIDIATPADIEPAADVRTAAPEVAPGAVTADAKTPSDPGADDQEAKTRKEKRTGTDV